MLSRVFMGVDRHSWLGAHLRSSTSPCSRLRVLDQIGGLLRSFGVQAELQFYVATAIFTYVLGVAAQMTRNAQTVAPELTRDEWLAQQSTRRSALNPEAYPFPHAAAPNLRDHDDREQFTTGLDLLMTGIRAGRAT